MGLVFAAVALIIAAAGCLCFLVVRSVCSIMRTLFRKTDKTHEGRKPSEIYVPPIRARKHSVFEYNPSKSGEYDSIPSKTPSCSTSEFEKNLHEYNSSPEVKQKKQSIIFRYKKPPPTMKRRYTI